MSNLNEPFTYVAKKCINRQIYIHKRYGKEDMYAQKFTLNLHRQVNNIKKYNNNKK